jgi:4-nitrophenyl phosphatase
MDSVYDGAVLDLDGTIYRGEEALPGAVEAIARLRNRGIRTLFFSNNPTKSKSAYAERLGAFGIEVDPEEVCSSGTVTTRYLEAEHGDKTVFLIGAEGLKRQLEAAGIELVADATRADILVVSWTRDFGYGDLLAGYRAIEAGATFYGTDPDRLIPAAEGMVPGSGAIINAVAGTIEREPAKILGKPSREAQKAALDTLGVQPERCLVVGDRLNTDIALGERAGMTTVLVKTGVTTEEHLGGSDIQPDYVIDSFSDIDEIL